MPIQRDALLDSTGLQSGTMILADRVARLLDHHRNFFMHICHIRLW